MSHPTLAIRYHGDGYYACHGPEGGPLFIDHQHEAPADLIESVFLTHWVQARNSDQLSSWKLGLGLLGLSKVIQN